MAYLLWLLPVPLNVELVGNGMGICIGKEKENIEHFQKTFLQITLGKSLVLKIWV